MGVTTQAGEGLPSDRPSAEDVGMTEQQDQAAVPLALYLGPQLPRWLPRSVADVDEIIKDGRLTERHWLDVKREVGSNVHHKRDIARDLASFANDGGALLVGVEELRPGQFEVKQQELAGLPERVEEIAHSRCDPPLFILCHPLTGSDEQHGVLLVEIPPSPAAPHMVEYQYWDRGDKTKHRLSDSRVVLLHALRSQRHLTAQQAIAYEMARDPVPASERQRSHLFIVAQALVSPPDLLSQALEDGSTLYRRIQAIAQEVPGQELFVPNWQSLAHYEPRAAGLGLHSGLRGRQVAHLGPEESKLLDLEIEDSGRLSMFCGRGSKYSPSQDEDFIMEELIISWTRCLLTVAGELGRSTGYGGAWMIAVGVSDLRGRRAGFAQRGIEDYVPYSADTYVQGTEAVTAELLTQPGAVTRRLVYRLLRGLGVSAVYEARFIDSP